MSAEAFIRIPFDSREDWLIGRKAGLGGSDAATVLGRNPWKTNQELFLEKIGKRTSPDISSNEAVKYGSEAESSLRRLFRLDFPGYKLYYKNFEILQSAHLPWLQASVDGELTDRDGRKGILEIKTTRIASSRQGESWAGKVPDNYYCQVLHYLLVTGYDFAVLKAQLKYDYGNNSSLKLVTRHYHFERSELEKDMKMLLAAEMKFWAQVEAGIEPPLILPSI